MKSDLSRQGVSPHKQISSRSFVKDDHTEPLKPYLTKPNLAVQYPNLYKRYILF